MNMAPQEQRFSNTLASTNMVSQEEVPWCLPCDEPHSEQACPRNFGQDGVGVPVGMNSLNWVGEDDYICMIRHKPIVLTEK